MKKLLFIPRAIIDVLSVWNKQLTIKEKSSLTYTLGILKLKKWLNKKDSIIGYRLFGYHLQGYNNKSLQMLVKEVFIDRVYDFSDILETTKQLRIIDAGANVGLSVLFFKRNFKNSIVDAYEPGDASFQLLKKNVEENNLKEVQLVRAAISDNNQLLYAEEGFEPGSVNQKFSPAGNTGKPVGSVRLMDILQNENVGCVKLDIEGDEIKVLRDVIHNNSLAKVFCWLIEFHDEGEQREKMINEFEKNGFEYRNKKNVYCFWQTKKW